MLELVGLGEGAAPEIRWSKSGNFKKVIIFTFEMAMPGRLLGRLGMIGTGCFSVLFFFFWGTVPCPALDGSPWACLRSVPDHGPGASLGPVTEEDKEGIKEDCPEA